MKIVAKYDETRKYNAGEVGVAKLTVKNGGIAGFPMC